MRWDETKRKNSRVYTKYNLNDEKGKINFSYRVLCQNKQVYYYNIVHTHKCS